MFGLFWVIIDWTNSYLLCPCGWAEARFILLTPKRSLSGGNVCHDICPPFSIKKVTQEIRKHAPSFRKMKKWYSVKRCISEHSSQWGLPGNVRKHAEKCHCCSDSNMSLVCLSRYSPGVLTSQLRDTQQLQHELKTDPKVKPSIPTANSTSTPVTACTSRSYPINLLQKQHGAVPAKVFWQHGVSLPLRRGRHLSAEEEPVQSLRHQSQTKTWRPAVIQNI